MNPTEAPELAGARLFASDLGVVFSDVRLAYLLIDDTYERLRQGCSASRARTGRFS